MIARDHYLNLIEKENVTIARLLAARLDEPSLESLRSQLLGSMKRANYHLVINLGDVEYLPSRMLAIFVRLHNIAVENHGALYITDVQPAVLKTFEITQFHKILNLHATEAAALRSMD